MFRLDRILATATIALWAASASAEPPQAGEGGSQPGTTQTAPPAAPPAAQPQPALQPAPQAAPQTVPSQPTAPPVAQPVPQQGTPATVLDTKDYESLLGKGVRSANGDELGRVIDVIIDKDGRPRAAIIDFGGFLGVGTRKIAVDWRALRFNTDGKPGRLSLQLSRNQVRVSPEYKAGEPVVVLGPASPSTEGEQPGSTPQAQAQPPAPAQPQPANVQPAQAQPAAQPTPPATPQAVLPSVEKPPEKAPDK